MSLRMVLNGLSTGLIVLALMTSGCAKKEETATEAPVGDEKEAAAPAGEEAKKEEAAPAGEEAKKEEAAPAKAPAAAAAAGGTSIQGHWVINIDELKKNPKFADAPPQAVAMMSQMAFIITDKEMKMQPPGGMPAEAASYVVKSTEGKSTTIEATDKNGKKEELTITVDGDTMNFSKAGEADSLPLKRCDEACKKALATAKPMLPPGLVPPGAGKPVRVPAPGAVPAAVPAAPAATK